MDQTGLDKGAPVRDAGGTVHVETQFANRRAYFRQALYVQVDLRASGMRWGVPSILVDVSGGGCQITSRLMLHPRASVEFDLPAGGRSISLAGVVTKVRYTPVDRMFHYGIGFMEIPERERESLMRYLSGEQRRVLEANRKRHTAPGSSFRRAETERRQTARARVHFPIVYTISGVSSTFDANALNIGTGGIRLAIDRVLRTEWALELRITLPSEVLRMAQQVGAKIRDARPFRTLRVTARPLPGVLRARDHYVQRLAFVHPSRDVVAELQRFLDASHAAVK
jgi:hypothetical protein